MKTKKSQRAASNPKGLSPYPPCPPPATGRARQGKNTVIWGNVLEEKDFIKLPRTVLTLGRDSGEMGNVLKPRHLLLILALMGKQFQKKPVREYWETLAIDLGVKKDTVRKWAYELRDAGYLKITQHRGRDPDRNRPGIRNEKNSFDYSAFVRFIEQIKVKRMDQKAKEAAK